MSENKCVKCGASLPPQEGAGRPRDYCSDGCRRAAEMEIRRLDARIANLEAELSRSRLDGHLALTPADQLRAEIDRHEARLRRLLNGERLHGGRAAAPAESGE